MSVVVATSAKTNTSENIEAIRNCLGKCVKIELDDDRIVVGRFRCTDDGLNVVLSDAYEIRNQIQLGGASKKVVYRIGIIMVPDGHIRNFAVDMVSDSAPDPSFKPKPPTTTTTTVVAAADTTTTTTTTITAN